MCSDKSSLQELQDRLHRAESALESLRRGEVDLIVGVPEPQVVRCKTMMEERDQLSRDWQRTFDAIKDVVWILDKDMRILRANQASFSIFGLQKNEVVGRCCWEIVHGTTEPIPECPFLRMLDSLKRESIEIQVGDRWMQVTIDPVLDSEGRLDRAVYLISDITTQKNMQADNHRLATAINQAGEVIIITDTEGNIRYVNPAFETVTGYSCKEVYGQNPRFLKSGHHDATFYEHLWDTIAKGRTWKGRIVNRKKDGALYTEEATISPVKNNIGGIVSYVAVKRDITEQLRVSDEKNLLAEQLLQAQKLESVGRLAGGMAHDFNNMLSVILGYGENILNELHPEDPIYGDAKEIVIAGQRSAALTRQLLAFSRKQTLQPKVLNLNDLVKNLQKMLQRLIGEDIELSFNLSDDIGAVVIDPGQLEHVIVNLAVNSRDAMPHGGKLLVETTGARFEEADAREYVTISPGSYVLLSITDTGAGMDRKTLAKAFDPFFTTKEKGKGTGLGLSTAYGIIKQSGGYIWAYSEPGQGTTFKIYLPQTDAQPEKKIQRNQRMVPTSRGEHILVVEDEDAMRKLTAAFLTRAGYQVSVAANGGEALLLIQKKGLKPDLVITDVVMPNMNGRELAVILKELLPNLKVIYMSGYTDTAIFNHGRLEPGEPFIQKPFAFQDIIKLVQDLLQGQSKLQETISG